jgi:type IV pilus assembly protein PilW
MKQIKPIHNQAGFSIVELMVASVIGLIILSGAVAVFSSNNASGAMSGSMSRVQESGRVAMDILANDLRMAGYQGCADTDTISANVIANNAPNIAMPETSLQGAEVSLASAWQPSMPTDLGPISSDPLPGTDVVYVQHGSGRTAILATNMTNANTNPISLDRNPDNLAAGDLVMISDCTSVDVFRATAVDDSVANNVSLGFAATQNSQANLSRAYTVTGDPLSTAMRVMRFEAHAYYVANTDRFDSNGDRIPALFMLDLSQPGGVAMELVEGVENMQLLYGQQMTGGQIRYVSANATNLDFEEVISVQIGLLIKSIDNVSSSDDDRVYQVAGQSIGPQSGSTILKHSGGRQLRTSFNTTVRMRNQR